MSTGSVGAGRVSILGNPEAGAPAGAPVIPPATYIILVNMWPAAGEAGNPYLLQPLEKMEAYAMCVPGQRLHAQAACNSRVSFFRILALTCSRTVTSLDAQ